MADGSDPVIKRTGRKNGWKNLSLREHWKELSDRERHIIECVFMKRGGKRRWKWRRSKGISQAQGQPSGKNALKSMKNFWEHKENRDCPQSRSERLSALCLRFVFY